MEGVFEASQDGEGLLGRDDDGRYVDVERVSTERTGLFVTRS